MDLKGTSLIGLKRAQNLGQEFYGVNPATGEQHEPAFISATTENVHAAAELADMAFPIFSKLSGKEKGRFLRAIAGKLESETAVITQRANLETGLPLPRLQSEMTRTCNQLKLFAGLIEEGSWIDARIDHADPKRTPVAKPDVRSMMIPIGPVAVFGAGNFPLAFSVGGGDTASAFAAGCPVIVKAHPAHPGTSELAGILIAESVKECDLPDGTFSLLFDHAHNVGISLVKHPSIKAVGFTGSRGGGFALLRATQEREDPIPVYAEMSSVNPVFILPDALLLRYQEIAGGLHASVTLGVGQFCTNPGVVVCESGEGYDQFFREIKSLFGSSTGGVMLTERICRQYIQEIERLSKTGNVAVAAGTLQKPSGGMTSVTPVLFTTDAKSFLSDRSLREEVFGPSTLIVTCADRDELLSVARSCEGQLTASIFGTEHDLRRTKELQQILETKAGRVIFNGYPTGVEVTHAMMHGGPGPATSDQRWTSVGTRAIYRFVRPICFQDFPDVMLPPALQEENPLGIVRIINGKHQR